MTHKTDSKSAEKSTTDRPRLRHEFVGMMFAIAIGEVGLQTAALLREGHTVHFLPAYGHLLLATMVIATSWVGWSVSVAPGNRQDVKRVFQWEFVVLLIDVALVIIYFVLVRAIDFNELGDKPYIAPTSTVEYWVLWIFVLYLAWDIITKVAIYFREPDNKWLRNYGLRMAPTVVCLVIAYCIWKSVNASDPPHLLSADLALLGLIFLFRALKDLVSTLFPGDRSTEAPKVKAVAIGWAIGLSIVAIIYGVAATKGYVPLPLSNQMIAEMQQPL